MISFRRRRWLVVALLVCAIAPASAFQVLPRISDADRKLATLGSNGFVDRLGQWLVSNAVPMIKSPVHEAITLNALDCTVSAGGEEACVTLERVLAHQVLLYGVRWPDDPPFSLNRANPPRISHCDPNVTLRSTAQPKCWKALFSDADKTAKTRMALRPGRTAFGPGDYLLYRSHFGDLQFIHSMAAYEGETAYETGRRMKMWARFLWGIGSGELATNQFIRTLGIDGMERYFPGDMTATNLFATGIVEVRRKLDHVAIGALLHMVQDSFSQAHAGRQPETGAPCPGLPRFPQPGTITQFYSYSGQVGSRHDAEDTFNALALHTLQRDPSVVGATRGFLALWEEGAGWEEAEKYFECVFTLGDPLSKADAGPFAADADPVLQQIHEPTNYRQ